MSVPKVGDQVIHSTFGDCVVVASESTNVTIRLSCGLCIGMGSDCLPNYVQTRPGLFEYFDKEQLIRWQKAVECKTAFRDELQRNFLSSCGMAICDPELQEVLVGFVSEWCREHLPAGISLDDEQAAAVGAVARHTLVTARAGSGKTRTLVARAAFLVRHCGVRPSQLLLLAFNRKAAEEMRERLKTMGIACPHVMTFHSLAYAVVQPEEALLRDEPDDKQRSSVTDRNVQDFLRDPEVEEEFRWIMMRHYRADWETIIGSGVTMSREEGLQRRRSLELETLDGKRVKSFGEKVIANFLFEHNIPYGYEWSRQWNGRIYRPDFILKTPKIVIEFFGRVGDAEYNKQIEDKRQYWASQKKDGWTLLEYFPRDLGENDGDGLKSKLARDLTKLGMSVERQSDEDIWKRIQERVKTRFAEVLTHFIGRCRKSRWTPEDLDQRLRAHKALADIEVDILSIASRAYRAYLDRIAAENQDDFDGLMERAAIEVHNGTTTFDRKSGAGDLAKLRFIMVDEYQDFSPLFHGLLEAIRLHNPHVNIFSVGDDWQAINSFAGSDLKYFHGFNGHFSPSSSLAITTNYRSTPQVVATGNQIMTGRGEPARPHHSAPPGKVLLADLSLLQPSDAEELHWKGDTITPAVRRLIRESILDEKSVALLARQNYLPFQLAEGNGDIDQLRKLVCLGLTDAQREKLHVGTAHSYKGREADVVLLLDAIERRFPKIHPDWVYGRIFEDRPEKLPEKLIEEERRLFYVACTRAKSKLIIITEKDRPSPFLENLRSNLDSVDWQQYPPFCPSDGDWIIQVGNAEGRGARPTMDRSDVLREKGYKYNSGGKHWRYYIERKHSLEWIIKMIPKTPWFVGPDGIEIRICKSDGTIAARLALWEGNLVELPVGESK